MTANTSSNTDVVVVGSGIGGLTAALTLARKGYSVTVLEAGKQFGGYINPFKRGKYGFDPGLHYIGECAPGQMFHSMMSALDLHDKVRFREIAPDGIDRLRFPGYAVDMPKGPDRYRSILMRDFPHERAGIDRFFKYLSQLHDVARMQSAERVSLDALRKVAVSVPFLLRYGVRTYKALLDDLFTDPMLKAVLAAQGGDYGLPPGKASALIGMGVIDHYMGGAYFPIGGSRALRDALVDSIRDLGGDLRRNHRVEKILVRDGAVYGVRCTNGVEIHAKTVVSNADATVTYGELIEPEHVHWFTRYRQRTTSLSLGSVCMFIGTDLDVAASGMTDGNIWHFGTTDLDKMYNRLLQNELPPEDFFFLSSPSLKDPVGHTSPAGHHTLELVTLCPYEPFAKWEHLPTNKRGAEYNEQKSALAERFLPSIERYVPGIRAHIKVLEVSTPVTNVSFAYAPRGAIYGPNATPLQFGPFRFQIASSIKGLYLCGASTTGAGVVPAGLSGWIAGRTIAKQDRKTTAKFAVSKPSVPSNKLV